MLKHKQQRVEEVKVKLLGCNDVISLDVPVYKRVPFKESLYLRCQYAEKYFRDGRWHDAEFI